MMLQLLLTVLLSTAAPAPAAELTGAWQVVRDDGTIGTWIVTDEHFSIAWYGAIPRSSSQAGSARGRMADDGPQAQR